MSGSLSMNNGRQCHSGKRGGGRWEGGYVDVSRSRRCSFPRKRRSTVAVINDELVAYEEDVQKSDIRFERLNIVVVVMECFGLPESVCVSVCACVCVCVCVCV